MSDRIAVMNQGNVEQIGTPTDIYDRPATVFVAGFIGQETNLARAADRRANRDHVEVEVLGTTLKGRPVTPPSSRAVGDADGPARNGCGCRWSTHRSRPHPCLPRWST